MAQGRWWPRGGGQGAVAKGRRGATCCDFSSPLKPSPCPAAQVYSGLLWLSHAITVQLLELHTKPPLDACTYVGIDSGAPHLRMVSVSVIVVWLVLRWRMDCRFQRWELLYVLYSQL